MKKIALLLCPLALWAKGELGISLAEKWDSNLPQNTSDYAGWTLTPLAWIKQSQKLPYGFAMGTLLRADAEYLEERRDPLLNDPALNFNVWGEWKHGALSYKLTPGMALFVSPDREIVKRSVRHGHDLRWNIEQHRLALALDFENNAYGDTLRNALNWDCGLGYQWKPQNPWLDRVGVSGGYSQNLAETDTSSYDSKFVKFEIGMNVGRTEFGLEIERAWKDYAGLYADLRTADSIYQHNDYWNSSFGIEQPLLWGVNLKSSVEYRWKESNIPLYSYERWLFGASLNWKFGW